MSFQSATKKGASHTGSDTWITPQWIIDKIGISDLDPCGYLPNGKPIVETAKNYFTEEDDGLTKSWQIKDLYTSVFVNFPYSESRKWLSACKDEYVKGRVTDIIVLCFVRSETKAWQENVPYATGINFINKRIKFLDSNGVERGNGNAPSCLIAFGENAFKRIQNVDGIITKVWGHTT